MKVVLTGGGTGGHVFPLVLVARRLREKLRSEINLLYIGSGAEIEREAFSQENIEIKQVMAGKRRNYFSIMNFIDIFKVPIGVIQSLWHLLSYMPDVVFSKGGYVSFPVVVAAWIYRIPIVIHESDAVPGTANRVMGKLANAVILAYPTAQEFFDEPKTAVYGNPARDDITGGNAQEARKYFNFTESKMTVLLLGGSQGSRALNKALTRIFPQLLSRVQVIHQTGKHKYEEALELAGIKGIKEMRRGYFPVDFMDAEKLRNAFALADLVVSRAGANSISDIAANSKAAILIPLEKSAHDHQRVNAYEIAKVGGALVLEENNIGENLLMKKINQLLNDEELRRNMGQKIKAFHHPNATDNIADGIISVAKG